MIDKEALIKIAEPHIEEILDELNIEYKYDNGWYCINCPFHGGDNFNLKWRDGSWFCFSVCKRAYSMFDVIGKILGLNFIESVKFLANLLGVEDSDIEITQDKIRSREQLKFLKKLSTKSKSSKTYNKVKQTILNDIEDYHHPYMLRQGFKPETLTHFNIGYARNGILKDRVCFPIDAPDGTIISVSGRSVYDIKPKYHILGNTDKSITLYNISRIGKSDNYIIVVEGFKSCMQLYQWGYKSVVAVMGSNISDEQVKLLLKLGRKVICIGDNDEAGQTLNQKIYNRLYKWLPVVKIDMSEFTDIEKASPCDLLFEQMCDLDEKLREVVGGNT